MTRLIVTLSLLVVLSAPALAAPTQISRDNGAVSHQHRYWMSQDFQRLVFWQPQAQSGVSSRR